MRVVEPLLKQLSERDIRPVSVAMDRGYDYQAVSWLAHRRLLRFALQAPCDRYLTVCRRRAIASPLSRPTPRIGQSQRQANTGSGL